MIQKWARKAKTKLCNIMDIIEKCELRYRIILNMKAKLILIHAKRDNRYKHIRQRLK